MRAAKSLSDQGIPQGRARPLNRIKIRSCVSSKACLAMRDGAQSSIVRAIAGDRASEKYGHVKRKVGRGRKRAGVVPAVRSAATSASPIKASSSIKASRKKAKESKEKRRIAERRQTLIRILHILTDVARPPPYPPTEASVELAERSQQEDRAEIWQNEAKPRNGRPLWTESGLARLLE